MSGYHDSSVTPHPKLKNISLLGFFMPLFVEAKLLNPRESKKGRAIKVLVENDKIKEIEYI